MTNIRFSMNLRSYFFIYTVQFASGQYSSLSVFVFFLRIVFKKILTTPLLIRNPILTRALALSIAAPMIALNEK